MNGSRGAAWGRGRGYFGLLILLLAAHGQGSQATGRSVATYEDLYGPPGSGFQAQISFVNYEGTTTEAPQPGYGLAIDDLVIEWTEKHPIHQAGEACSYEPGGEGQCADLTLSQLNLLGSSAFVEVTLADFNAEGTQALCVEGICELTVTASSELEREGETVTLRAPEGSPVYTGAVPVSSTVARPGDGIVFLQRNGNDIPSLRVSYVDRNDGVRGWTQGADAAPGIAGVDDNGDCSGPSCTPGGQCDPGTDTGCDEPGEHCPEGIPARWSDDSCGCRDNPLEATTTAFFNTADVIVAGWTIDDSVSLHINNDGDSFADDGERVNLHLTLRNISNFDLEDLNIVLSSDSPHVACIVDPGSLISGTVESPALPAGGMVSTAAAGDGFAFVVNQPGRSHVGQVLAAEFLVTLSGTTIVEGETIPIGGSSSVLSFAMDLDLDWSGGAGDHTASWSEVFDYASLSAWSSVWEDDFDSSEDGNRCQYNDPGNPYSNNFPDELCSLGGVDGIGRSDWTLSSDAVGTSMPRNRGSLPDARLGSMHMGLQSFGRDTIYMSEQRYATGPMANGALPGSHGLPLGMGRSSDDPLELSFWHMLSIEDARLIVNLTSLESTAAAVVMVGIDDDDDGSADGAWMKIAPYLGVYLQQRIPNAINCSWDPVWDGSIEDDLFSNIGQGRQLGSSSTCFPEFVWACVGLTEDPPCLWDGDTRLCVDMPACYPETGLVTEGYDDPNSANPGVWIRTAFDLYRFRGRRILIRFLDTAMFFEGDTWFSAFPISGNRDDGWWIDDLQVTGLTPSAITLLPDLRNEVGACSGLPCSASAGLVIYPDRDGIQGSPYVSDAPGRAHTLDASGSTLTDCPGAPEWRFESDYGGDGSDETILRDWLSDPRHVVAPLHSTSYRVKLRCSAEEYSFFCNDEAEETLEVGISIHHPCDTLEVFFLRWNSDVELTWVGNFAPAYDTLRSSVPADFVNAATCIESAGADTVTEDLEGPAAGSAFYYLVRTECGPSTGPLGSASDGGPRAGRVCP